MHREGHIGAALLLYAPLAFVTSSLGFLELGVLGAVGAVALAMVPDWDMRVQFVSHRGPTHTVWFALAVGGLLGVGGGLVGARTGLLAALGLGAFAFVVGTVTIGSHILADALTPMGVRPLVLSRGKIYGRHHAGVESGSELRPVPARGWRVRRRAGRWDIHRKRGVRWPTDADPPGEGHG